MRIRPKPKESNSAAEPISDCDAIRVELQKAHDEITALSRELELNKERDIQYEKRQVAAVRLIASMLAWKTEHCTGLPPLPICRSENR